MKDPAFKAGQYMRRSARSLGAMYSPTAYFEQMSEHVFAYDSLAAGERGGQNVSGTRSRWTKGKQHAPCGVQRFASLGITMIGDALAGRRAKHAGRKCKRISKQDRKHPTDERLTTPGRHTHTACAPTLCAGVQRGGATAS
jgi:hypothetical protein